MSEHATMTACPQCGSPVPLDAPRGLCPKCVLGGVAFTEPTPPAESMEAPPIETVRAAFPQLEVVELIGQGGMGFVYKARQPHLERLVALKLLCPKLGTDPAFAERFGREARLLARLNHPNIVAVFDFGQAGGFFFLQMEFVDGVNLRQAMRSGKFAPDEALALVPKICDALQFAHDEGIMHRDIKPENILIDRKGRVKIADFGLAKIMGADRADQAITATGVTMGTPRYMAPEQLEDSRKVDHRADIYSLGVVFYEMLTGELPLGRFDPPSRKVRVDVRLDEVVLHTLEKEPDRRYQHASQVKTDVEKIASSDPQPGPRPAAVATEAAPGPHGTIYVGGAVGGDAGTDAGAGTRTRHGSAGGPRRWSGKAVTGAILVAFSLALGIPAAVGSSFLFVAASSNPGSFGIGGGEILVLGLGSFFILLPGIAGTVLGFSALREVRAGPDRKQGLAAAVFAALGWPLALLDVAIAGLSGWGIFQLVMALAAPLRLPPVISMTIAALVVLLILLCVDWLIFSAVMRRADASPPRSARSRFLRLALAVLAVLLALGGVLLQALRPSPRRAMEGGSHFALTPEAAKVPAREGSPQSIRWKLAMAPSQAAAINLTVLSNGVEVLNAPMATLLRTPSGKHLTGTFSVNLSESPEDSGEAQWRAVLDAGEAGTAAFAFMPPGGVRIRWNPVTRVEPVKLSRQGSFDGAILTGRQMAEDGSATPHIQWTARLQVDVRPSDLPLSRKTPEIIEGQVFRIPFNLASGQVATFSLVRKDAFGERELALMGAYAMAPSGRSLSGEVRWVGAPNRAWATVLDNEGGRASSGGLALEGDWVPAWTPESGGTLLLPDSTLVIKLAVERDKPAEAGAELNVRIVTRPHGLPAEAIRNGSGGTGTNWVRTVEELTRFAN